MGVLNKKAIVKVLMKRDGLSLEEALAEYEEIEEAVMECVQNGDFEGAYDELQAYGFEPDYIAC